MNEGTIIVLNGASSSENVAASPPYQKYAHTPKLRAHPQRVVLPSGEVPPYQV